MFQDNEWSDHGATESAFQLKVRVTYHILASECEDVCDFIKGGALDMRKLLIEFN